MNPPSLALRPLLGSTLPDPLPEGWLLPEDEDMGHSFEQAEFIYYFVSLLRAFFAQQGKSCFVGFDQHIGLDPRDARVSVAPDVYVLPQAEPPQARGATWLPWENHGLVPTLAIECVSATNRKKDYLVAPDKYAHLGVQELIVFEPWLRQPGLAVHGDVETLRVYRLDARRHWSQVYGGDGPTRSQVLGLWLHENDDGTLRLTEDRWGKRALLTPTELLSVETEARKLAEDARQAAEDARQAAEDARQAAEARALAAEQSLHTLQKSAELRGKAEAILAILGARGLIVSAEQSAQVRSCQERATLEAWLTQAMKATSAARLLALPRRARKS